MADIQQQRTVVEEGGLFRSLFQHMAEGVAIHELVYDEAGRPIDYRILDVNPAYQTHTGLSYEQVVGKTSFEAYGMSPPPYLDAFIEAGHYGRPSHIEFCFVLTNRQLAVFIAPLGSGRFATIGTDITETKQLEARQQQGERTFAQIFDLAPNSIAVTELDGTIITVNQAYCELVGWSKKELIGRRTDELGLWVHDDVRVQIHERLRREGRCSSIQLEVRTRSAEIRLVEFSGALIDFGNRQVIVSAAQDITEVVVAERARRQASEELERFFSLALDLLCIANTDGRFLRLNPAWEQVLGYPLSELVGARYLDYVHPDDMANTLSVIEGLKRGELSVNFTNRYRHRDGSWRYIEWRSRPYEGGVVYAAARDVTDKVMTTLALQRNKDDLERSQAVARLGSYRFDVATGTWESSRTLDDIFGIGPDFERTVQAFGALLHPEWRDEIQRYLAEDVLGRGVEFDREYRVVRYNDHATRWVHGTGSFERDDQGRILTMFGTIQDVTERHEVEENRLKFEENLRHAQKLESLGVLAGGIAHDFNNLLTSILGNVSLLIEAEPETSMERQPLLDIELASRRAADLCRQLLAYSGKGRFVVHPVKLTELVREMTQLLLVSVNKKVVINYALSDSATTILADATQIRQVVMNLIINASDAIGDRSGVVTVTTGSRYCDVAYLRDTYLGEGLKEGTYSFVEVTDNGCGMTHATLARIFDPFFTTKFVGRGLGLAAVLGIVRGHQGAVHVKTVLNEGTAFTVLFPTVEAPATAIVEEPPSRGSSGTGLVLIVDDEERVRSVTRNMLQRNGYEVLEAVDGQEAVELFEEHAKSIRAVLLDMTMPRLDGASCLLELQRIKPDVKVLMTSGYNEQHVVERLTSGTGVEFVQKPFTLQQLLEALRRLLEAKPT
jgi:PAS domain S-box-containing protein